MTLSRTWRHLPVLAAFLALAAAPAAGQAEEQDYLRLGYAGFLGPVQVVAASVGLDLAPGMAAQGPYSMALDVTMTGPLEKLVPFHMTANSRGRTVGGGVLPAAYDSMTRIYDDGRAVRLTYADDGAVAIDADPPTVEARQAREKGLGQGTLDPLSAVVALVNQVIRNGACAGRVAVFDGTRRFDLEASPAGTSEVTKIGASLYQGPATECAIEPVFIGGFRQADVDAGIYPRQATMWIAPVVAGAPPVPVRVTGASALGNLRLDLVEAWAMEGATAATDDPGCATAEAATC
ncbi:MAG: DUF3108 domain-containing protein [Methylocystis sp.]